MGLKATGSILNAMNLNSSNPAQVKSVTPVRIFEQAVEQIRELITSGAWPVGSKLPTEHDLSKQFNVSRSSVREALRVLEAEGLVEVKRGSGTYVTNQSVSHKVASELASWLGQREETLEQVLQVRESIEALSASLAATNASQQDLENVIAIIHRQEEIIGRIKDEDECVKELAALDTAFHLAISAMSGNDIANEIITHIMPAFVQGNQAVLYLSRRGPRMIKEHGKILAALESRNPAAAEKAMRDHIHRVCTEMIAIQKTGEDE